MKHITKTEPKKPEAPITVHKAINWLVSVILLAFAIWSIYMNAQGQSYFKQANALYADTDKRVTDISNQMQTVKDACLNSTVVIPTTTITQPQETK